MVMDPPIDREHHWEFASAEHWWAPEKEMASVV
jgi:hypothetical protein